MPGDQYAVDYAVLTDDYDAVGDLMRTAQIHIEQGWDPVQTALGVTAS
jgi:hypothetical protein